MIHKTPKKKGNGGRMNGGANMKRKKASAKKAQEKRKAPIKFKGRTRVA